MSDIIQSLHKQLAKAEENLRLIQERKAGYVLETDVPLQLVKDERRLEAQIADLRVEIQRQRIADGLEKQRQQMWERVQRRDEGRLRIVGRRPLDVADYFKDREREQVTIGQLLAEPATRLVSVIGHGGMGKTALACKVLRDLERRRWPHTDDDVPLDGIVYLGTRTAGISLERLFLDCAKLLGVEQEKRLNNVWTNPQIGAEDKVSHLLEALSDGQHVILLDNMDDLLDERGRLLDEDLRLFFEHSLTTSHGARLLVTSRVALAFRREVMRFDRQVKLLEGLPTGDGVALLRELDPNGDCGLRDAPEEQLAHAVSLLHGVPRALEVLAGILANDPFASLNDVLEQFYEQEDVVQALIEENYKRLDTNARRVIEALAVFRRPVVPLAVDYLLEPFAPGLDVPGIVQRLTRTNIVSVDRATKTVTLHPIDQDYAYSQLPEAGAGEPAYTRPALERCAAGYYVQLRTPPETWHSIDDLEPQLVEFEHRVRAGDYDGACRVLEPIDYDYLHLWGHYARLVEMREKLLGQLTNPHRRMSNLDGLGSAYRALGQFQRAVEFHEQALTIACGIGERQREGAILGNLGRAHHDLGQFRQAISFYEQALAIAREISDRAQEGRHLGNLGNSYRGLGQIKRAVALYEQALVIAQESEVGDRREEGVLLGRMGWVYRTLGKIEQAIELYKEALVIAHEIGDRREEGLQLGRLGVAYLDMGQVNRAIVFQEQALTIAHEIGDRRYEGLWLGYLGRSYRNLGQVERAIGFHEQDLSIAREIDDRKAEGTILGNLGTAYRALGQVQQAAEFYEQSLTIAREIGDRRYESVGLGCLGHAYYDLEQPEQAIEFYEEALVIARDIDDRRRESRHLLGLGRALLATGKPPEARQCCAEACDLDVPETGYQAVLALGIVLLYQPDSTTRETFMDAAARCRVRLDKTAGLYQERYALAAALVGQAVCDPRWAEEGERAGLLAPALVEYRRALENCAAKGVVQDVLRDLELIRAAGVEGLEPVFELLEGAGG